MIPLQCNGRMTSSYHTSLQTWCACRGIRHEQGNLCKISQQALPKYLVGGFNLAFDDHDARTDFADFGLLYNGCLSNKAPSPNILYSRLQFTASY